MKSTWQRCCCCFCYIANISSVLPLPVEHRPQTTCLHPALCCSAASIFLQLYLYPAVHISFSRSLLQVFLGRPLPLWPCGAHCSACLVMLSSFPLNVCPSQFHFFLRIWSDTKGTVCLLCKYSMAQLRSITCHGITQCYLPPDTSEHTPP